MAEYNIPNKLNYTVMAGASVWIAKYTDDVLGDYAPVGNLVEDCDLGFNLERLENWTNQYGIDSRDRNPVISKAMTFTMKLNELVRTNLEYLLGSSGRLANQTENVNCYEKVTFAAGSAVVNGGSAIVAVQDVLPNSGESTYDQGATGDYTVTAGTGTLTLTAGSTLNNGNQVIVYYTISKTTMKYPIMDEPNLLGALKFIARKSHSNNVGYNTMVYIPSADIALDGSIPLAKKTWSAATLKAEALADATNPTGALGYWSTFQ